MTQTHFFIQDEASMLAFGQQLACLSHSPMVIFLSGELGAGKTTLVRGLLQGFGHHGNVKSPTYTIVEPYEFAQQQNDVKQVFHFDLYRLNDPQELEALGLRDYLNVDAVCIFEWPERGKHLLPQADLACHIEYAMPGRTLMFSAQSPHGEQVLQALASSEETE